MKEIQIFMICMAVSSNVFGHWNKSRILDLQILLEAQLQITAFPSVLSRNQSSTLLSRGRPSTNTSSSCCWQDKHFSLLGNLRNRDFDQNTSENSSKSTEPPDYPKVNPIYSWVESGYRECSSQTNPINSLKGKKLFKKYPSYESKELETVLFSPF